MYNLILDKNPKITKRKLAIYNLEKGTNYSLIDLGIRIKYHATFFYGCEYYSNKKLTKNEINLCKTYYTLTIDNIKNFLMTSRTKYKNNSTVEVIVDDLNEPVVTIDHIDRTISSNFRLISQYTNEYMCGVIFNILLKNIILGEKDYEIL